MCYHGVFKSKKWPQMTSEILVFSLNSSKQRRTAWFVSEEPLRKEERFLKQAVLLLERFFRNEPFEFLKQAVLLLKHVSFLHRHKSF